MESRKNHLVKVVHNLSKLGLVETFKGKGGGICLAKPTHKINIGKTMRELEEDSPMVECFSDKGECILNPACKLKAALSRAQDSFYQTLEEVSLEDIVKNKSQLKARFSI